ncbi:MAG: LA2681 family HEPN domain-containing protein [Candidatus Peribacteraceae bacterium]|nr:LA2681 family HEPN domain-containing protein [Candidatus Peribacteraceae bacterium]
MKTIPADKIASLNFLLGREPEKALALVEELGAKYPDDPSFAVNKDPCLVDIGTALKKPEIVEKALSNILDRLANLPEKLEDFRHILEYNVGNAYYSLSRFSDQSYKDPFRGREQLTQAKIYHRKALLPPDSLFQPQGAQMYVNCGNALSSLGRPLEAIERYEKVLQFQPNHPIALGSLALELEQFYYTSRHPCLLLHSVDLLKQALGSSEIEDISGVGARAHYEKNLDRIEKYLHSIEEQVGKKFADQKAKEKGKGKEDPYISFCREHHLFLNFSLKNIGCQSIYDTVEPSSIVVPIMDNTIQKLIDRPINEIKEKYVTSRLLFYEGTQLSNALLDEMTVFSDSLDYAVYGVESGKIKMALEGAFNVLDKIAILLNNYMNLGISERRVSFTHLWYTNQEKDRGLSQKIIDTKSHRLYGLYDLARDFGEDPSFNRLKQMRDLSTHRYLVPHVEMIDAKAEPEGEAYHVYYPDLAKDALYLLKTARNALIYSISYINEAESQKAKHRTGMVAPMFRLPYKHYGFKPL